MGYIPNQNMDLKNNEDTASGYLESDATISGHAKHAASTTTIQVINKTIAKMTISPYSKYLE